MMQNYIDRAVDVIVARPEASVSVFLGCFVVFATCFYFFITRKMEEHMINRIKAEHMKKANTEGETDEKVKENEGNEATIENLTKFNLEKDDLDMIKNIDLLDMDDPHAVKKYVNTMRTKSYKQENLSAVDKEKEEETKNKQLAQIFALMEKQKETFGNATLDDVKSQMALYS